MTEASEKNLQQDYLNRGDFVKALERHINDLAAIQLDHLASPRVLAVNAPWGSGKSWIAEKLRERLHGEDKSHPVAFIDAFRYDHHDDAFAVIAASVLKALKPNDARRKSFLSATGAVLKSGAPALFKGVADFGMGALGLNTNAVVEAIVEGASTVSEKAVEKLLDVYANTQVAQDEFVKTLSTLTKDLAKPFVVIIDELDRCRPSFALEFLERIKHLFASENVVFVLFWNANSICESVRHSYGQGTNAELYLSKFVAYSVPVPVNLTSRNAGRSRHEKFIRSDMVRVFGPNLPSNANGFLDAVAEFADYFDASLRDVEKVVRHRKRMPRGIEFSEMDFAYAALLKVRSESSFVRLLAKDQTLFLREAERFAGADIPGGRTHAKVMFHVFTFLADETSFRTAFASHPAKSLREKEAAVHAEIHASGGQNRHEWLFHAANLLNDALTSPG